MSPTMQFVIDHLPLHFFGTALIGICGWAAKSLSDLSKNVASLNIKVAVVLERVDGHETRITKLEGK